jgi:LacI family transcriptional regulator
VTTEERAAPRKTAGLRDVAALAGVSMGTVSNVLNRPETVGAENRRKVEEAIAELNFVGSYAAVQFRFGKSRLIGVVLPDVGNPFWGNVLRGVESVTDETGAFLIVSSTHQETERESNALASFLSRKVDGLLFAPVADENTYVDAYVARGIRVVTFDRRLGRDDVPTVSGNNSEGAQIAAEHLLGLGHRRILLVNGPEFISWSHDRRLGVERALQRNGLDPARALFEVIVPDLTADFGEKAVAQVLEVLPNGGAIMCGNDLVALGVLRGLIASNRRVPDDYSLVGYDDVDFAAALSPALTTMRQPSFEMGVVAARMLLELPHADEDHIAFAPQLIVRGSTAPPSRPVEA